MTAHDSASITDPKVAGWIPSAGSADSDTLPEIGRITPRARDLARNNSLAHGVLETLVDNIIGSQVRLSAKPDYMLLGRNRDWAREWSKNVESRFRSWADTTECDAGRSLTLLGITRQLLNSANLNGDALAVPHWLPRPDSIWSTRLQTIESDRLQTPSFLSDNPDMRGGIRVDQYSAPIEYWILKHHPGAADQFGGSDNPADYSRIPAFTTTGRRRVIHLHDKERSGQSRGVSIFSPVMGDFKTVGKYLSAELQAATVNANVSSYLESDLPPEAIMELFGGDVNQAAGYWKSVQDQYHRSPMESNLILTLPVGTKFSSHNTDRPNTAFGGFVEAVFRQIAAGLNLPYELLTKDFSQTTYSSMRAALLEAWRYFKARRRWIKDTLLDPVYELWIEEALNAGYIDAPGFYDNKFAYLRSRWIFDGRGWVDPAKEAIAAEIRLRSGLSTFEAESAEQGNDWEEIFDQRDIEKQTATELGLTINGLTDDQEPEDFEDDDE